MNCIESTLLIPLLRAFYFVKLTSWRHSVRFNIKLFRSAQLNRIQSVNFESYLLALPFFMRQFLTIFLAFSISSLVAQPDYAAYDAFLKKFVNSSGKVNYAGIQKNKAALDNIVLQFSQGAPEQKWKKEEVMSYWINVYNAYTLKLIVDNYPIKSITALDAEKTWDVKRIPIGKEKCSLNQIENDFLRAKYNDPRMHFAVNCAAKSCPPLWNEAFVANKLEQQLENRTRKYISSAQIQITENNVKLPKIFDWYAADFMSKAEFNSSNTKRLALIKFLKKYSKVNISSDATVSFLDYDWSLNN